MPCLSYKKDPSPAPIRATRRRSIRKGDWFSILDTGDMKIECNI